jgi:hypothetical protein
LSSDEQEGPRSHNALARWLHSSERMQGNTHEQILGWMREAGLAEPRVVNSDQPIFGKIVYFVGRGA